MEPSSAMSWHQSPFLIYKIALTSTNRPETKEGVRERTLPSKDPPPVLPSPLEDIILKIYFISQLHYGTTKSCESNLRTDYLLTYFI